MTTADVAVIGLGAMGSAALYQLARRGMKAIGIDRFDPPHDRGSSHGETRITRQAIGEGAEYVPLVLRSHAIWRELEAQSGECLLHAVGGLILAGERAEGRHHAKPDFLGTTVATARQFGIAHEVLSAEQIAERFPQLILQGDEQGYYEPGAGFVLPEKCIEVQLTLARRMGAGVFTGERVLRLEPTPGGLTVHTSRARYAVGRVVLSAGAWVREFLPLEAFRVHRQVLYWFEPEDPALYAPERFPVFIWLHGPGEDGHFYGFPMLQGSAGVKLAGEQFSRESDPDQVEHTVSSEQIGFIYRHHVAPRLRALGPRCTRTAACLYTSTPDGGFVLDWHPELPGVFVVSPCSGHGFKHSAGLGEAIAQVIAEGRSAVSLEPFSLARFAKR
ncbi:N-methyl-L-tryptophan oxidase [Calidithermus roseus]|uniref:Monomeric sarcosine oxidase n=1 Tax=Calidithermus roseus TaxID=1644118 RepID=A0A399EL95_9DEIN|nr:N-methyl-L-tryptophan oxidase [Calidithermus roseus]RIH83849.1 Monomeric sarcosine oxidase [Calidithermus roseus]